MGLPVHVMQPIMMMEVIQCVHHVMPHVQLVLQQILIVYHVMSLLSLGNYQVMLVFAKVDIMRHSLIFVLNVQVSAKLVKRLQHIVYHAIQVRFVIWHLITAPVMMDITIIMWMFVQLVITNAQLVMMVFQLIAYHAT